MKRIGVSGMYIYYVCVFYPVTNKVISLVCPGCAAAQRRASGIFK